MSDDQTSGNDVRLDKWLWAARFFKTRQLAVEAVNGGKVQVNGQRAKPGRAIRVGARLEIHKGGLIWEVEVVGISKQRRPASEALLLYREDEGSRMRRQEVVLARREQGDTTPIGVGRPTKRNRRQIQRFRTGIDPGS
jgi:ribosome-associated heat shock protein Hsp15